MNFMPTTPVLTTPATPVMPKITDPQKTVIEWIDYILDRKKWTGTDLARNSGLAPSTILRLINNKDYNFVPTVSTLQKIAKGSGYPIPTSVMEALGAENYTKPSQAAPEAGGEAAARPSAARSRVPTVELRHVSSLPASLAAAANPRRENFVPSPPQLDGDETAFAFHNPDRSFGPWLKVGSLMYATKRRDPVPGDLIMITTKDEKTFVRLLRDIDETGLAMLRFGQSKDDEAEKFAFDDIKDIAIVVGSFRD